MAEHLDERVRGRPVFDDPRGLSDRGNAFPIQTELVSRVVADAADLAVLGEVARASRDRRQTSEGETDAEDAVAGGAFIAEGELWFYPRAPRRRDEGHDIGRLTGAGDREGPREGARRDRLRRGR